jgi:putative methyltransferase (TIGR04325 family)
MLKAMYQASLGVLPESVSMPIRRVVGAAYRRVNPPPVAAIEPPSQSAAKDLDHVTFSGDYQTFAEALSAADDPGYHGDIAIDRYVRRYREVQQGMAAMIEANGDKLLPTIAVFGMTEPVDGVYEVLDFGGGYGAMYDVLRVMFPERKIRWTVIEVPPIVARGSEMGASQSKIFATEIPERRYSIVIASGSIQYTENPVETFSMLTALDAPLMFIGRVPIAPSLQQDRLTVESIPSSLFKAKMPAWFFSPKWRSRLACVGEIALQWNSPGDTIVLDGEQFCYQAFLLRRV